mgnify:CR=1 FL=1
MTYVSAGQVVRRSVHAMKTNSGETFLVQIRNTQNATWQGTVAWTDGRKQETFRSALELIKLIDSVLSTGENQEGGSEEENRKK